MAASLGIKNALGIIPSSKAISGLISSTVTALLCSAINSAVSTPVIPPPSTNTFPPGTLSPDNTSNASITLAFSIPGIGGFAGVLPVAKITTSYPFSSSVLGS